MGRRWPSWLPIAGSALVFLVAAGFLINVIVTGFVPKLSRRSQEWIDFASSPLQFVLTVALIVGLAALMGLLAIGGIRQARREDKLLDRMRAQRAHLAPAAKRRPNSGD
jgi:hypothetical protein